MDRLDAAYSTYEKLGFQLPARLSLARLGSIIWRCSSPIISNSWDTKRANRATGPSCGATRPPHRLVSRAMRWMPAFGPAGPRCPCGSAERVHDRPVALPEGTRMPISASCARRAGCAERPDLLLPSPDARVGLEARNGRCTPTARARSWNSSSPAANRRARPPFMSACSDRACCGRWAGGVAFSAGVPTVSVLTPTRSPPVSSALLRNWSGWQRPHGGSVFKAAAPGQTQAVLTGAGVPFAPYGDGIVVAPDHAGWRHRRLCTCLGGEQAQAGHRV